MSRLLICKCHNTCPLWRTRTRSSKDVEGTALCARGKYAISNEHPTIHSSIISNIRNTTTTSWNGIILIIRTLIEDAEATATGRQELRFVPDDLTDVRACFLIGK